MGLDSEKKWPFKFTPTPAACNPFMNYKAEVKKVITGAALGTVDGLVQELVWSSSDGAGFIKIDQSQTSPQIIIDSTLLTLSKVLTLEFLWEVKVTSELLASNH
jgi:hypothetical protein